MRSSQSHHRNYAQVEALRELEADRELAEERRKIAQYRRQKEVLQARSSEELVSLY